MSMPVWLSNGCPCPEYTCPPKQKPDILVLDSNSALNVPIIINGSGKEDRDFFFEFENGTEVYRSCGLTFQNRHFIFGGRNEKTQVAMVEDCTLKLIGKLSFNHDFGACTNVYDRFIYLCFNDKTDDHKKCRYSSSPTGSFQVTDSNYAHRFTRIAADQCKFEVLYPGFKLISCSDDILAVGSWSSNVHAENVKAEVLNTNHNVWTIIQDYPFVSG